MPTVPIEAILLALSGRGVRKYAVCTVQGVSLAESLLRLHLRKGLPFFISGQRGSDPCFRRCIFDLSFFFVSLANFPFHRDPRTKRTGLLGSRRSLVPSAPVQDICLPYLCTQFPPLSLLSRC
jgi:hypothetical protein